MVSCGAINRGNSSSKLKTDDMKGWHNVPHKPKDMLLRQKWLVAMKRDPPYPKNEHFSVCGLHFTDECFERDLRYQLQGGKRNFKLIATAVPILQFLTLKINYNMVKYQVKRERESRHKNGKTKEEKVKA